MTAIAIVLSGFVGIISTEDTLTSPAGSIQHHACEKTRLWTIRIYLQMVMAIGKGPMVTRDRLILLPPCIDRFANAGMRWIASARILNKEGGAVVGMRRSRVERRIVTGGKRTCPGHGQQSQGENPAQSAGNTACGRTLLRVITKILSGRDGSSITPTSPIPKHSRHSTFGAQCPEYLKAGRAAESWPSLLMIVD